VSFLFIPDESRIDARLDVDTEDDFFENSFDESYSNTSS